MRGTGWLASDGPSNIPDNHHGEESEQRSVDDLAAVCHDWILTKKGRGSSGDPKDRRSYYGYGQDVYAVGDATVVTARMGSLENVPGFGENFHPAVPVPWTQSVGTTSPWIWAAVNSHGISTCNRGVFGRGRRACPTRSASGKIGCSGMRECRTCILSDDVATVLAGEECPISLITTAFGVRRRPGPSDRRAFRWMQCWSTSDGDPNVHHWDRRTVVLIGFAEVWVRVRHDS